MKKSFFPALLFFFSILRIDGSLAHAAPGDAPTLVVFNVQPLGVERMTAEVTTHLLRQELFATGAFLVVDKGVMDKTLGQEYQCSSTACAGDAGKQLGASRAMIGTLSRLGEKFFLEVKMVDVERAEVVNSGQMTSATVEDLDTVAKRLAAAMAEGKGPEETMTVDTVTAREAEEARRRQFYSTGGFKIGALFPVSDSFGGVDYLRVIDLQYFYEIDRAMIEFSPGVMWGYSNESDGRHTAGDFRINLGCFYVPFKGDVSPYIGGGGGLHFIAVDRPGEPARGDTAFGAYAAAGIMAFRTSNLHLIADVRYEHVFSPLDGYGARGISAMVGLTFRTRTCCFF